MDGVVVEVFRQAERQYQLRLRDTAGEVRDERPLEASGLSQLLEESERYYDSGRGNPAQLGQALYRWLDGPATGWLQRLRAEHGVVILHISVEEGLRHLPWELLLDQGVFLSATASDSLIPVRRVDARASKRVLQNRPLRILFMATSPLDVQPVLQFEQEEARIFEATRRAGLELIVEESGTLRGLQEWVDGYDDDHFDVVHLTGHADVLDDQPAFICEDDTGNKVMARAQDIANVFRRAQRFPRLLFLSGCRTGQAPGQGNLPSLCEALVRAGVPAVLGWALPVGDSAATQAAGVLYERLATGVDVAQALAHARQVLYDHRSAYWPLLRLYTNATPLGPLVTPPKHPKRLSLQQVQAQQRFLDAGGKVEVCPREHFVGRRRQIQAALRTLSAVPGEASYAQGILLHGMGGLGKSSLAARLCDRLAATHRIWVWVGRIDETALRQRINRELEGRPGLEEINQANLSLNAWLRRLLEDEISDKPILFVFDDFEQNLRHDDTGATWDNPGAQQALQTLLDILQQLGSRSRVLVTSRYVFPLQRAQWLTAVAVNALRDADLRKKTEALTNLQERSEKIDPALRQQAIELAAGNPRLLERLDAALGVAGLDHQQLLARLRKTQEDFREDIILRTLLAYVPEPTRRLLACLALYRLPVPAAAVLAQDDAHGGLEQLDLPITLGLVEAHRLAVETPLYYLSPLVGDLLGEELSEEQAGEAVRRGAEILYKVWWSDVERVDWERVAEARRLALKARAADMTALLSERLTNRLLDLHGAALAKQLCEEALELGEAPMLLMNLGRAEQFLGNGEGARKAYERALAVFAAPAPGDAAEQDYAALLFNYAALLVRQGQLGAAEQRLREAGQILERVGDVRAKAITQGKIADILYARGERDEALRIRVEEELPVYERLGDVHSTAVTQGQIADILYARGDLDEALRIRVEEELPVYERLGDVHSKAMTQGKIADILSARGDVDEALRILVEEQLPVFERLGDVRAKAVAQGKIADILYARGDLDEALRIRVEEQLPVYERLGDVRAKAVAQGKIADILYARGDLDETLRIRVEEELPVYERLGDVREKAVAQGKIADILYARGDLDEALRIRVEEKLPVFERLGDVRAKAVTQGKIADILYARGDLDEALRIRQDQLLVYERLGDVRAKAVTHGKIADILYARGEADEALRIRVEEQLPVFERLGDVRAKALTQGKIADILYARGDLDEALRIRVEEELPVYERLGDVQSKAVTQGQVADILHARGDLDEALRIRVEEELPVYERLGDVRAKAITQGKIADILSARGHVDEALRMRQEEQLPVYERLGDVREKAVATLRIGELLQQRGEVQAALARFADAYDIVERLRVSQGVSVVGAAYVRALWDAGQHEYARQIADSAMTILRDLDHGAEAAKIAQLLEELLAA